jgi:hypothetical protein
MNDAADYTPVVDTRLASGVRRQMRLETHKLIVRQPEKMVGHSKAPFGNLEAQDACQENRVYRSRP